MPVTNPELLTAMEAIATQDSPANRRALYLALLESELVVPIAKPLGGNKPGLQLVTGTTDVEFVVLQDSPEQTSMLAFTDESAARLWKSECYYIASNAVDLFAMALEMNVASIVLNIAGPTARGKLMRWEFQALAASMLPQADHQLGTSVITPPPDAEVKFSALVNKPSNKFMDGLKKSLASIPEIAAGYLMQAKIGDGAPHLVAGVQLASDPGEEDIRRIMNQLGDKISEFLPQGEFIDFIVIDNELNVPVAPASDALVFKR